MDLKFKNGEIKNVTEFLKYEKEINFVEKLEKLFCRLYGVKYAIACNSGTSALHASLASLGLKKNDEVIVPALGVVMGAYAAIHLGLKPVFVDVNKDTFLIDCENIKKKITKRTKAIMTISLQGLPVQIDPILKLAKKKI